MLIWLVQSIFLKTVGQISAFCFMSAYISGLCLAVILAQRKRAVQLCSYSDKQKSKLQNHYTTLLQLSQLHVLCYWLQSVSILKWQVFKMMDSHYQKFICLATQNSLNSHCQRTSHIINYNTNSFNVLSMSLLWVSLSM